MKMDKIRSEDHRARSWNVTVALKLITCQLQHLQKVGKPTKMLFMPAAAW